MKKLISVVLVLCMIAGMLPAITFTVSAAVVYYYPTTWAQLRKALQSSEEAKIVIREDVTIEHTFDARTEYVDHTQITINGKKTIDIRGDIHFYNGLQTGGLFNLDSADDKLTISGYCGDIVYHLYDRVNNIQWNGDMFYLTAGELTLGGNASYIVDYGYTDSSSKVHQAVVGGTGGKVIVDYGYLDGNTIFGEGIDFVFKNGSIGGVPGGTRTSYRNVDLFMTAGCATFEGCLFERGLGVDGDVTKLLKKPDDVLCIDRTDKTANADKEGIMTFTPCAFYRFGLSKLTPAMPDGTTLCQLGTIGLGETITIEALGIKQNTGLGLALADFITFDVYHNGEKMETLTGEAGIGVHFDFDDAVPGDYDVFITHALKQGDVTLRKIDYGYRVTVVEAITHIDVSLDKSDMNSLHAVEDFADVSHITWYEKSKTDDTWTANPTSLRDGYTYAVEFSTVSVAGRYPFANGYTVSVNGEPATSIGDGTWRYEYVKTGYLTRIELFDIQRPAPGQHPDFTAHKDNPPYCDYEVVWTPVEGDRFGEPLTADDVFQEDTMYMLEVVLTAQDGFEFNFFDDEVKSYVMINREYERVYHPIAGDHTVIVAYAYYHTSHCISEMNVRDVQYPIPGKTPDIDYYDTVGVVDCVEYDDDDFIDWYAENNSGFGEFDGEFKANLRYQAYITLETLDGYWFATDNKGNLEVEITFDHVPMSFAYVVDTLQDDGTCTKIEAARTFEPASEMDGVFVDGMLLTDGQYMDSEHWGVRTEDTVDKSAGYAYYENGVLTLNDFYWESLGDYDAIASYRPLTIEAYGENHLYSPTYAVSTSEPITLTGDGITTLFGEVIGMFMNDDLTVDDGTWYVSGYTYDGIWLGGDLTVNGGYLDVYGDGCGLYGDDFPTVAVNGGELTVVSDAGYDAIGWCNVTFADGAEVLVDTDFYGGTAEEWDGVTDFAEYAYVKITVEDDVLLGDMDFNGVLNMRDAMTLYSAISGKTTLTDEQTAAADYNEDGTINMRDVMLLYAFVSGK